MVILSAAFKGIEPELLEAARVDGANERQVFRRDPSAADRPTIAVVATTMVIFALKAFDIVYVMTNGNFDTQVIAFRCTRRCSFNSRVGRAAAIAVVLLIAIGPDDGVQHPPLPRPGGELMTSRATGRLRRAVPESSRSPCQDRGFRSTSLSS